MSYQRRFWVALLAVLAGYAAWHGLRVTGWERPVFTLVMRGFSNPPLFVTGHGTRESPWALRTEGIVPKIDHAKAPVVVSIGDDPDGVFQTSPPSPTDLAVVLKNLHRLGAKSAAVAAVLAWEEPDSVALKGLEMVLGEFEMVVHAAPLTRGTLRQPMPEAFLRASLPVASLEGDLSTLPIVNRVAVPDVVFAGAGALAGFSTLDAGAGGAGRVPMLARWEEEDRVVLAFPLLAVLARYDLPVGGVRVRVGETLELGPNGPMIPIDRDGCLALPPKPVPSRFDVAAESLVLGKPGIFPKEPGLIVLRDDQSWASGATKRFSGELASVMASIGSDAGLAPMVPYPRLAPQWEWLLGSLLLAGLVVASGTRGLLRSVGFGLLLAICVGGQWLAAGLAGCWLPGTPLLLGLVVGMVMCRVLDPGPAATPQDQSPVPAAGLHEPHSGRQLPLRANTRSVTIWRETLVANRVDWWPEPQAPVDAAPQGQPEPPAGPVAEPMHEPDTQAMPDPAPEPISEPTQAKRKTAAAKATPAKKAATKRATAAKRATPAAGEAAQPVAESDQSTPAKSPRRKKTPPPVS